MGLKEGLKDKLNSINLTDNKFDPGSDIDSLQEKVYVVTGGSAGIGGYISSLFMILHSLISRRLWYLCASSTAPVRSALSLGQEAGTP